MKRIPNKRLVISIPVPMYKRFLAEREGYGAKNAREVVEAKLRFWEGKWEDRHTS